MEKKFLISYDQDADVVYMSFGAVSMAYGDEIEDGTFARYDPDSHELVGITILEFSKKFGKELREVAIPVKT